VGGSKKIIIPLGLSKSLTTASVTSRLKHEHLGNSITYSTSSFGRAELKWRSCRILNWWSQASRAYLHHLFNGYLDFSRNCSISTWLNTEVETGNYLFSIICIRKKVFWSNPVFSSGSVTTSSTRLRQWQQQQQRRADNCFMCPLLLLQVLFLNEPETTTSAPFLQSCVALNRYPLLLPLLPLLYPRSIVANLKRFGRCWLSSLEERDGEDKKGS
jgi:hypothetical protein